MKQKHTSIKRQMNKTIIDKNMKLYTNKASEYEKAIIISKVINKYNTYR